MGGGPEPAPSPSIPYGTFPPRRWSWRAARHTAARAPLRAGILGASMLTRRTCACSDTCLYIVSSVSFATHPPLGILSRRHVTQSGLWSLWVEYPIPSKGPIFVPPPPPPRSGSPPLPPRSVLCGGRPAGPRAAGPPRCAPIPPARPWPSDGMGGDRPHSDPLLPGVMVGSHAKRAALLNEFTSLNLFGHFTAESDDLNHRISASVHLPINPCGSVPLLFV